MVGKFMKGLSYPETCIQGTERVWGKSHQVPLFHLNCVKHRYRGEMFPTLGLGPSDPFLRAPSVVQAISLLYVICGSQNICYSWWPSLYGSLLYSNSHFTDKETELQEGQVVSGAGQARLIHHTVCLSRVGMGSKSSG